MIAENITSNECRQLAGNANNPNTWKIISLFKFTQMVQIQILVSFLLH